MKVTHLLTALALSACLAPAAMAKSASVRQPRHVKMHVSGKLKGAKFARTAGKAGKVRKTTGKRTKKSTAEMA
jgi:hypothetical protein